MAFSKDISVFGSMAEIKNLHLQIIKPFVFFQAEIFNLFVQIILSTCRLQLDGVIYN